jgi:magnesium-transporting ATPase (P-type)
LLWLFIINLGIAYGAGLYESRIVLPLWFAKSPTGYKVDHKAMAQIESGRKFWGFVTTVPLTLLTLANLYAAWQSTGPGHGWWLGAAFVALVERISTFSFFIPTAIRLQRDKSLAAAETDDLITRWVKANTVRNLATLVAWLMTLKALVLGG